MQFHENIKNEDANMATYIMESILCYNHYIITFIIIFAPYFIQ